MRIEDLLFYTFNERLSFNSKQLKFISDEKCRTVRTTDPSGSIHTQFQRYVKFENEKGDTYFVSFSIYSFAKREKEHQKNSDNEDIYKCYFYLNVGIDPFTTNISEFRFNKWVKIKNDVAEFWHDGTITVLTSQKKEITLDAVQNACPYLLKEGKVFLGKLDLSKPELEIA